MRANPSHSVCWTPLWNDEKLGIGFEHLLLSVGHADSVVLGVDPDAGAFRLAYRLLWDSSWRLRSADLRIVTAAGLQALILLVDNSGRWSLGDGTARPDLDGCRDIDIWPTPFTNSFPICREALAIGERREFRMAWVSAFDMTVRAQPQAYTRLEEHLYRFENLDGSGFHADLRVDDQGLVIDFPGLFRRIQIS